MILQTEILNEAVQGITIPFGLSMTAVLMMFYFVFAAQIYLISIYFPGKVVDRIRYVLDNFPPEEYPKLYPSPLDEVSVAERKRGLTLFVGINRAIAFVGLMILIAAIASGYEPSLKGGDEILVLAYFVLQIIPALYQTVREYQYYRLMHKAFAETKVRKAGLKPRKLFDFVSPQMLMVAGLAYIGWVIFFVSGEGPFSEWRSEVFITLTLITGMNIAYIVIVNSLVSGMKLDPYQDYTDQLRRTEIMVKSLVFSSILISAFLSITIAADRYAFEIFDPLMTSLMFQVCVIFSVGIIFRFEQLDAMNFDVYRDDKTNQSGVAT
jgi:magnesium-transporting ATPase (P-type)